MHRYPHINKFLLVWVSFWLGYIPLHAQGQDAKKIDSLQNALRTAGTDTVKTKILLALAVAYRPDIVTKEFYYASEALTLSQKTGWDKGIMLAEQLLGDCYNEIMSHNDALAHYKLCMAEAKKLQNIHEEAYCLQLIYHCYHEINDMEQACITQFNLVQLSKRLRDPDNECKQRSAYALCLSEMGRYAAAIAIFRENITFATNHFEGNEKMNLVGDILNSMAISYIKINMADSALQCLREAMTLAKQAGNYSLEAYVNSSYCDVYSAIQKYDSAIIYGERTVKMAEVMKSIDLQLPYCKLLSRLLEHERKPIQALYYYKRFDSLANVASRDREIAGNAMQVNKINLQQLAERNMQEKRSLDIERRNQQVALIAAIIALLALTILMTFIYRNLKQKQKANKIIGVQAANLLEQNAIIDKALKEKEILLKETHHRVKNNLQLISSLLELQAANLEDDSAKKALRAAQDRVLSIATVHSKLYGNSDEDEIEFSAFVSDLFTRLNNAFGNEQTKVQFENAIPTIYFPLNTVVLLGIILNELITNSFKHAFSGVNIPVIKLSLSIRGAIHTLVYYDNGKGLPGGIYNADTGSLGLYLVRRLSKQLKGTSSYKYDTGSIFTIVFPDAAS